MEVVVPVSVGELVDKVTILRIKNLKIKDSEKLGNIRQELARLMAACEEYGIDLGQKEVEDLQKVNLALWEVEDGIRDKELRKEFDHDFVELARSVYLLNDKRFELKKRVNLKYGSSLVEEKSYKEYQ